jgi:biotin operon repressor
MSHKASYWAISRDGLHPTQKLTLMALADCHNGQTGECFPSQDTLARIVNVSRATINRALDELEQRGLITRVTVRGIDGRQQRTRYELHFRAGNAVSQNETRDTVARVSPMHETVSHPCDSNLEVNRENPPSPSGKTPPRGSRLPEDWTPTDEQIAYARQKGMTDEQIERTAADFADYWIAKPGKDGRKADWNRTWQRWVRTEIDRRGPARLGNGRGGDPRQIARNAAAIAAARRMG